MEVCKLVGEGARGLPCQGRAWTSAWRTRKVTLTDPGACAATLRCRRKLEVEALRRRKTAATLTRIARRAVACLAVTCRGPKPGVVRDPDWTRLDSR